jgi:hypothetical protein
VKKHIKLLSIAVLSVSILIVNLSLSYAEGSSFKDVSVNFWGNKNVLWAVDNKITYGYPDGTFKPNQPVSQEEFLVMLIRAYQPSDFTPSTDSTKWSVPYLNYWTKLGWHLIMPTQATNNIILSRGQVAQYLINATGKNYTIDDSIQSLLDTGISVGKTDKSLDGFKKDDLVTRAEAVTFIKGLKQLNATLQPNDLAPSIVYSYNLKIEAGEGGTIPAGKEIDINGKHEEGSKIPIIARSNVGYYFVNWASNNGGTFADANDSQTTFTMPGKDTIVTAHFALEKIK